MTIVIRSVADSASEEGFFSVQQRALGALPLWRPNPLTWEMSLFDEGANPIFEHLNLTRLVALRDDQIVGRVAAWVDDRRPELGVFGFFDVTDDVDAGTRLIEAARDWCMATGCTKVRGPIDLWTICSAGVPITGFELSNTFALHHGGPQYATSIRAAGLQPVAQLYTWQFGARPVPAPAMGIAKATLANPALSIVEFDPAHQDHWAIVEELYAACYVDHDWFTPMSRSELRLIAGPYIERAVSFLVFVRGTPAAMSIGLRNMVESSVRIGDIIPPEPIQRVLRPGRRPHSFRQWLFGVAPQFRGRAVGGLSTALYVTLRERAEAAGLERGEAAWSSAIDAHLNAGFTAVGARRDKTYHVFESRVGSHEQGS